MILTDSASPYAEAYYLEKVTSNNAFSHQERSELLGHIPRLRVAPLIVTTPEIFKLEESDETAFEEVEEGQLISCKGLKNFLRIEHPETRAPITVIDNHNHALYFWLEAYREGKVPFGAPLVHVDQHKDMRDPGNSLTLDIIASADASWDFTMHQVHVGSFIVPALKAGVISQNIILDGDASFEEFEANGVPDAPFILDIDLDVFAQDLDYMDRVRMRRMIRALMARASCITIATSPYFIPFDEANSWLQTLLEDAGITKGKGTVQSLE